MRIGDSADTARPGLDRRRLLLAGLAGALVLIVAAFGLGRWAAGHARAGADAEARQNARAHARSEEHTSELQSLMRISYAVFCLKKKNTSENSTQHRRH